jgi:C1A family cysteine protease
MPIRMVDDDNNDLYNPGNNNDSGGGGNGPSSGCLYMLLPLAFNMFRKYPKATIALAVVGAIFYFGSGAFDGGGGNNDIADNPDQNTSLSTGATMKQEVFDKADVFAALDPTKNAMPARVSLLQYAPKRQNQGEQGSCVAWSSTYAARTILESASTGQNPNSTAFSPSFVYNQVHLPNCQGAYINEAMEVMQKQGVVLFNKFPYDAQDCSSEPSQALKKEAQQFRMRGFNRLTKDGNNYELDIPSIKQNLAKGAPVVIGMMVGGTFMENMFGKDMWVPSRSDYNMSGFGGHAMCVIGYDDNMQGGALQIMNSWGPEWGNQGVAWVKYKDFLHFSKEAYGLDPLPKKGATDQSKFSVAVGLVTNGNSQYIPMKANGRNVFSSASIRKGTKFKMEVTNNIECYVYVFGAETDGKSYTLFPYSAKHSPFCGITGTRLFPKDQSMMADQVGAKDYMAVVVTKKELDYAAFNNAINTSRKATYSERLSEALGNEQVQNVSFQSGEIIKFECDAKDKNAVGMVVEINKQ